MVEPTHPKKICLSNWKSSPRFGVKRKNMRNHLVQYVYFNIDDFTVHNQSFILRYSCSKDPMPGSNQQKKSTLLGTNIYHLYIYIYIDIPRWRKENHLQKWFLMGYVSCQEGISVVYKLCSAATSGEVNFEVLHSWRSQEQAIFWHQDCWATKKNLLHSIILVIIS